MLITGLKYPIALGRNGKNFLTKEGGDVVRGRWININHDNWEEPIWKKTQCTGTIVDRSLGNKPYTQYDTDLAVFTEYEDPSLKMVSYDLVPLKSPVFDMASPPPQNIRESYDWLTIEGPGLVNQAIGLKLRGVMMNAALVGLIFVGAGLGGTSAQTERG